MPRYIRNTVVLAKVETTPGVDIVPTVGANAILVSDMTITPLDAQNIDRNLVRGYFGASEQLVGPASVKVSFTVELAGSGTAATAPAWGALMQGCAFAEAAGLTTQSRCEYTPISTALKSLSIYSYDDGVLHKLLYAMGNFTLSAKVGERPTLKFEFTGLDGGITAVSPGATTLTAWQKPVAVTKANTVIDISLGATYLAATGVTAGTTYPSTGLELMCGNDVSYTTLLSSERVDITNRQMTGHVDLDLTAAQEVSLMTSVKANTTTSLGFTLGTVAGNKILIHCPTVQLLSPSKQELNGSRLIGYDLRMVPAATGGGNDEIRLVTL